MDWVTILLLVLAVIVGFAYFKRRSSRIRRERREMPRR